MIKLYDYGNEPVNKIEQISRHDVRQSAPSGWTLAFIGIGVAIAVVATGIGLLILYLRYRYG